MRFTQTNVKALVLPPGKTDHIEWETGTGLGYRLRLAADGKTVSRTWVVQYRHGGHTRRMSQPAGKLDAESARRWAKSVNARVALGQDVQVEKRAAAQPKHTFKSTVSDYLRFARRKVRARSYVEKERYLTGWYLKPLHGLALNAIARADVARALDHVDEKSGAIVCARARAQASALFVWALARGLCLINPVVGTSRPESAPPRQRVLSNDELAAIWRACKDDDYGRCVKLLVLTGARRSEIGGLRWSELDGQNWKLPASRSKNRHEHQLPLMPAMRAILETVAKRASSDCLFGTGERGFVAWSSAKAELDTRLKLAAPWRLHDLRRSMRTALGNLGVLPHVAEMILNHRGDRSSVELTYDLSRYEAEVLAALAKWHAHIRALVDGDHKVIDFPQSA